MVAVFNSADELLGAAGTALGPGDWLTVTQDRIDRRAEPACVAESVGRFAR